jgi:hypothetical protein
LGERWHCEKKKNCENTGGRSYLATYESMAVIWYAHAELS